MNPAYLPLLFLFIIILTQNKSRRNICIRAIQFKNRKGKEKMLQMAKRFIGKECIVYTFDMHQLVGTIKEAEDGAIILEDGRGTTEAVNLDYILRIREYPRNKKGNKKSVVLD